MQSSTGPAPTTYDPAGNILSDAKFRGLSYVYDSGIHHARAHAEECGVDECKQHNSVEGHTDLALLTSRGADVKEKSMVARRRKAR